MYTIYLYHWFNKYFCILKYITNQNQLYSTRTITLKLATNAIKNKFAFIT